LFDVCHFKAPEEELKEILTLYYNLGFTDKNIAAQCMDHFDKEQYGIRCVHVYSILRDAF